MAGVPHRRLLILPIAPAVVQRAVSTVRQPLALTKRGFRISDDRVRRMYAVVQALKHQRTSC
jgi:hypothetical protein